MVGRIERLSGCRSDGGDFINPYEGDKALIGTTDIAWEGRAEDVTIAETEIDYLLAAVNRYFKESCGGRMCCIPSACGRCLMMARATPRP